MLNILVKCLDKIYRRSSPFHNTILTEEFFINSDWQEIFTKDLVKVDKDNHLISIHLELPYETPFGSKGIKVPSGEIINPEIVLIDEKNNKYEFVRYGAGGTEISKYHYKGCLPKDKIYRKILVRSDFPIKATSIMWSSYNLKDRK